MITLLIKDFQEFAGIDTTWRWAGPFGPTDYADDTGYLGGHGTCMASCALGVNDGLAKKIEARHDQGKSRRT